MDHPSINSSVQYVSGHIVDGPKVSAGNVKAGMIQLAHTADATIIHFYVYADRAWYFNNWNNFFLPKPFARVIISFSEMIKFTPVEDPDTFESQMLYLEMIMGPELRINPD